MAHGSFKEVQEAGLFHVFNLTDDALQLSFEIHLYRDGNIDSLLAVIDEVIDETEGTASNQTLVEDQSAGNEDHEDAGATELPIENAHTGGIPSKEEEWDGLPDDLFNIHGNSNDEVEASAYTPEGGLADFTDLEGTPEDVRRETNQVVGPSFEELGRLSKRKRTRQASPDTSAPQKKARK
ncbi:Uu.00g119480.m01.CDS01 [Anthostomella pinea]|uniref:Uu.00g119480.m01.CDS01 n=1 Tax=Anthostomella pinea TaxID=933095 RepID=A0AAI8VHN0_9PEZI|nr:Uu.00g119480.m01.CDS01 [Anthostomella pinea]